MKKMLRNLILTLLNEGNTSESIIELLLKIL